jgi:dihydroflavonol-4-reductase
MTTVVTGAAGFLGGVVVRMLLARGREVRALDLRRTQGINGLEVEWVPVDILDRTALRRALDGAEFVHHTAGMISVTGDPTGRVWTVNVDGVREVAEAARAAGVRRLVHCSSVHAFDFGAARGPLTEDHPHVIDSRAPVYDRSKAAGEDALRQVIDAGLDAVIVNPTALLGPYDYGPSRMGKVLLTLFRHRLPALIAGGFDWVDVRDVASSMIAAETHGCTGENHLLPGHHLTVTELAEAAERVSGVPRPRVTVPMWFARLWSPMADVAARRSGNPLWYTHESLRALRSNPTVSSEKARRVLAHEPRPIDETIGDLYRWFRAQGWLDGRRGVRALVPA